MLPTPAELEFSPWLASAYAASIYIFLLAVTNGLLRLRTLSTSLTPGSNRYGSIDGLRGLLAVGVFIHHSFAAYGYFTTGIWEWSTSPILNQLGQTTVALFFMITGFLFTIKASKPEPNWISLYQSRLARLVPLYFILVTAVFMLVMSLSNWNLKVPLDQLLTELFQWLTFVCFGRPDINQFPSTWTIIAGVNWSLKFEVLFYIFCIPALYWAARIFSVRSLLTMSLLLLSCLLLYRTLQKSAPAYSLYAAHFLGGIATAYAYMNEGTTRVLGTTSLKFAAALSFCALLFMTDSHSGLAVFSTAIIFASIVGGGSIFGVLNTRPARWLGDISYGIYLLHGIFLWTLLSFAVSPSALMQISILDYWMLVLAVSTCVLLLASLSYVTVERPIMLRVSSSSRRRRKVGTIVQIEEQERSP